ncbi:hypothetical protein JHD46_05495 [Sulfurimonas sp. SAG-AH-194-C20]|nr:hypothetical protein [Sulfurimonas sp. SAG-AH-194-C20]MDF1879094.1 hypothetical protein [Sulfurimonas sp. SAG-AH-194-C20]
MAEYIKGEYVCVLDHVNINKYENSDFTNVYIIDEVEKENVTLLSQSGQKIMLDGVVALFGVDEVCSALGV